MALSEADLTTMAQQGAGPTSRDTYATVQLALEANGSGYSDKRFKVFPQGSYGNDTNIYRESDVDVVIRLDSIFTYDLSALPADQSAAFSTSHGASSYTHVHFREHVVAALKTRFGDQAHPGTKAVRIEPFHNRRKADVIAAIQHRKYRWWSSDQEGGSDYVHGISFHKSDGTRVINYPKQHRENLIAKNQRTNEWFKHIIRIFKNSRERMEREGRIQQGIAPSYYIEGLLYSVPTQCFGNTYADSMVKTINWLLEADRTRLTCANEQYPLFDGNPDVTWTTHNGDAFLLGLVGLWNDG